MKELAPYLHDLENWIRSGLFSPEDVIWKLSTVGIDADRSREIVNSGFARHRAEQRTSSDVIALVEVFDQLAQLGYISLHCAGYTTSDLYDTIDQVLEESGFKAFGYLGYHEQDLMRALESGELTLSFGAFRDTEQTRTAGLNKAESGQFFKEKIEAGGLKVNWNGDPATKLMLTQFDFTRVWDGADLSYRRCIGKFPRE